MKPEAIFTMQESEYIQEMRLLDSFNLPPHQELTAGIFLSARNWERETGKTLLSLSVDEIIGMFEMLGKTK